jgi:acyl-CoA thioesterase FadM
MYVWGRLARVTATVVRLGPLKLDGESRIALRCLPGDVDQYGHMNNARYNMITDLGRMDLFMRTGVAALRRSRDWGPMMDGTQMAFVREIRLWARFELRSSVDAWRGRHFLARHRFVHPDGRTAALMLGAVGIYDFSNRRFVEIDRVVEAMGDTATSRQLEPEEERFLDNHLALRGLAKRLGGAAT